MSANARSTKPRTLVSYLAASLIAAASTAASVGDKAAYEKGVKGFVDIAYADMPRIPLYQPYVNVAMQKNVSGYQYWFHRRLDYRALVKG